MTKDDDRPGDDGFHDAPPALVRRKPSRLKAAAGVAGLAAILGSGAYATTTWLVDEKKPPTHDVVAAGPGVTATSAAPSASAASASAGPSASAGGELRGNAAAAPDAEEDKPVEQRIREARERAAKDGHPIRHARTSGPEIAKPVGEVEMTNEGSLKEGASLRTVWARYDLTGQREMLWLGDKGKKVGAANCTQRFRFSNEGAAQERPTMLLCYRTSADKSVITVAVTAKGRPDTDKTVNALERQWNKMS